MCRFASGFYRVCHEDTKVTKITLRAFVMYKRHE